MMHALRALVRSVWFWEVAAAVLLGLAWAEYLVGRNPWPSWGTSVSSAVVAVYLLRGERRARRRRTT